MQIKPQHFLKRRFKGKNCDNSPVAWAGTMSFSKSSHTQIDVNGGASEPLRKAPQTLCKLESGRTILKFSARKR